MLRQLGYEVTPISGKGAPDILVRPRTKRGANAWGFEVKSKGGKQTDAQEVTDWPIVRTVMEALKVMGDHQLEPF